jgi:hypothetical protein
MTIVFNAKTYTGDKFLGDAVGYNGAAKTLSVSDDLLMSRTPPKPTTTFSGVARTQFKLTRTHTLTGALTPTGNAILTINVSVPVGMASGDIDALLNDCGAALSGADFKTHVKTQKISF